ncbi:hypothetical protein SAMN06295912_11031 [Sphingomonas laterariae]|uniref:4-amino-4-deoxy-L-arabinose transferase n=1 Tax=Edaphosphingomonas laterariae TaxID=861865 RepID=A0A239FTH6_9SPHN|nr:hypothetical protein [Sphingomonas laterariae]SNS60100.1 hypothetical protein SAMN06295912_11031 [Sphingomonas laterariae]
MGSTHDDPVGRLWLRWLLLFWAVAAFMLIAWKWGAIHWFALGDTDDNLRIAEVRAWLQGQGWFDLRQYKLDPPGGANIHWSRLVDLPIAGLILAIKPFFGGVLAEKWAVAIAPLIALGAAMVALALTARRLVAPSAYPLMILTLACAANVIGMFMPLRIDHHGWQLAFLALALAGIADPARGRGGATLGAATALSLTIGLEMFPYLALAAGITGLRWVADESEAARLRGYGAALAAGCAIGFLLFASHANRGPVCDALSPVWLSAALGGGALLVGLSMIPARDWRVRLALAAGAGVLVLGGFAFAWPHCLSRPEGVSPELDTLWLSHVREARPIYSHGWRVAVPTAALPLIGLIGTGWALWQTQRTPRFLPWLGVALLALTADALLLWQLRAAAAAQLLALPGAVALGWALLPHVARHRELAVRIAGPVLLLLVTTGVAARIIVDAIPAAPTTKYRKSIRTANARCPTLPALAPIAKLPPATILTFVDFGPRLIATTKHKAIAGPYHRNGAAILDVQHAFRGTEDNARAIMLRHGASMVLICPGMSESTIYAAEAKTGFYTQLRDNRAPAWLEPVALPKGSPFKLWRVRD